MSSQEAFASHSHATVPSELVRAVLENPFADLPRLIVADWYEEHPDSTIRDFGYADHIRKQITDGSECYTFVKAAPWNVYYQATVRRGFIDEIKLLPSAWMGALCRACLGRRQQALAQQQEPNLFMNMPLHVDCVNCNSTGWIDGLAKDFCSRLPLTKLDLELGHAPDVYSYHWNLTGELNNRLGYGGRVVQFGDVHPNTVKGLMSDAGINVGRHWNNLPLIDWRKT